MNVLKVLKESFDNILGSASKIAGLYMLIFSSVYLVLYHTPTSEQLFGKIALYASLLIGGKTFASSLSSKFIDNVDPTNHNNKSKIEEGVDTYE